MTEKPVSKTKKKKIIIIGIIALAAIIIAAVALNSNKVKASIEEHKINKALNSSKTVAEQQENGIYIVKLSDEEAKLDNHEDFVRFKITSSFSDKDIAKKYKDKVGIAKKEKGSDKLKMYIEPTYEAIGAFKDGYAIVQIKEPKDKKSFNMGVINDKNEIVIPIEYDIVKDYKDGVAIVSKNELWGLVNDKGEQIMPFEYFDIEPFHDDMAIFRAHNKKYGAINTKGEIVFQPKYTNLSEFRNGTAFYGIKKQYGILNKNTKKEIPLYQYAGVKRFSDDKFIVTTLGGAYGLVDSNGKTVVAPTFNYIGDLSCGRALFTQGVKKGYLDKNGKIAIPATFDGARTFVEDRAIVYRNENYEIIDTKDKVIWSEKEITKDKAWTDKVLKKYHTFYLDFKDFKDGKTTFECYGFTIGTGIKTTLATGEVDKDGKFKVKRYSKI